MDALLPDGAGRRWPRAPTYDVPISGDVQGAGVAGREHRKPRPEFPTSGAAGRRNAARKKAVLSFQLPP